MIACLAMAYLEYASLMRRFRKWLECTKNIGTIAKITKCEDAGFDGLQLHIETRKEFISNKKNY